MWCPECQQQVSVRLLPGDNAVRCACCRSKLPAPQRAAIRSDTPAVDTPVPQVLKIAADRAVLSPARGEVFRWESQCPVSANQSWKLEEELKHIGRMASGELQGRSAGLLELDELLTGAAGWDQPDEAGEPNSDAILQLDRQQSPPVSFDDATSIGESNADSTALDIQPIPLADQVRAAARPSWAVWAVSSAASILGGLALVNGAALIVWSQFGGRPELLTIGLPGSVAGLGLLIVGHMLHGQAEH